jgi:hypothetical protein
MSETNKHGLKRDIPADVKRIVRKNSGFGCVICGLAFYHYEHFNPEFENATQHIASGITLLCGNHHDAKTRNRISKQTIINAVQNPRSLQDGFSWGPLEFGFKEPIIQIGTPCFLNPTSIITINDESIFSISHRRKGRAVSIDIYSR